MPPTFHISHLNCHTPKPTISWNIVVPKLTNMKYGWLRAAHKLMQHFWFVHYEFEFLHQPQLNNWIAEMGNGVPCLTVWMDGNIPLLKVSAFDNQLTIDQVIDQITKGSCERFRNVFSLFQQKERTICFSSSEFKVPQFYNVLNGLCLCLAKVFPLDPFLCNACSLERSLQLVLSWLQRKRRGQE